MNEQQLIEIAKICNLNQANISKENIIHFLKSQIDSNCNFSKTCSTKDCDNVLVNMYINGKNIHNRPFYVSNYELSVEELEKIKNIGINYFNNETNNCDIESLKYINISSTQTLENLIQENTYGDKCCHEIGYKILQFIASFYFIKPLHLENVIYIETRELVNYVLFPVQVNLKTDFLIFNSIDKSGELLDIEYSFNEITHVKDKYKKIIKLLTKNI